jgi:hypothetical protein
LTGFAERQTDAVVNPEWGPASIQLKRHMIFITSIPGKWGLGLGTAAAGGIQMVVKPCRKLLVVMG